MNNTQPELFDIYFFRKEVKYLWETNHQPREWWDRFQADSQLFNSIGSWLLSKYDNKGEAFNIQQNLNSFIDETLKERGTLFIDLVDKVLPEVESLYVDEILADRAISEYTGKELEIYLKVMKRRLFS